MMNNQALRQTLISQASSFRQDVIRKYKSLLKGVVFDIEEDDSDDYLGDDEEYEDVSEAEIMQDAFSYAFKNMSEPRPQNLTDSPKRDTVEENETANIERQRRKNKIAALRGYSLPSDYLS